MGVGGGDLRVLARKLASPFGHPISLCASSTCIHLRTLAGPFGQGLGGGAREGCFDVAYLGHVLSNAKSLCLFP